MSKNEAILFTSTLVLALLSILVFSLNIDLGENFFILALLPVGLPLAAHSQTRLWGGKIDFARIFRSKKLLVVLAIIIAIPLLILIFPGATISELINSGPQYITYGIVTGSILSLGGIGLTTVYKILGFPNFAHGDFLTLGAFIILFFHVSLDISIIFSIMGAIGLGIVLVVILEKALWKPLRDKGAGNITMLIASIGLALFLRNLILFLFGSSSDTYFPPARGMNIAGITVTIHDLIIVAASVILMFLIHLLLTRAKIGKAMRAVSDNKSLAKVSGINVDRVILFTWIIGISLAVFAGFFYGIDTLVGPNMGWTLLLPLFAAVIVGGIGNPYGAMIGGMIVGISQEFSVIFIPPEYKPAVSFVLIIIILIWKPEGLMGG